MTAILGIETSCDETAAAVVVDRRTVSSNVVLSQIHLHRKYTGVVPEIASRAHLETLDQVLTEALQRAERTLHEIDAVAVSSRPGLVGCLIIGLTAGKTLAWICGKPLFAVNHVHAHVTSPALSVQADPWPAVALVASGGHTSLYHVADPSRPALMGSTTDDAAGEAFDKVSAMLKLGFPGGPAIERAAKDGDPRAVDFPRSLLEPGSLDFSFSGIKTAVLYHVHGSGKTHGGLEKLCPQDLADIAASFQAAVVDVVVTKALRAVQQAGVSTLLAGGGVLANSALRRALHEACDEAGVVLHLAQRDYCTDNAAMIAAHAFYLMDRGLIAGLDLDACAAEQQEQVYAR